MRASRTAPTRHALLQTNERLETARKGLTLLERRQRRLAVLLRALVDRWRASADDLEAAYEAAERTRTRAFEREGRVALEAAAFAREDHAEVLLLSQRIQGLPVPLLLSRGISKRLDQRGYGLLGTSAAVDEAAAAHEALLEALLRHTELELAVRVVLAEVGQLTVRVNALRHRLIPDLEERKAYVEFHLAEREREERLVQRFVKRKRERERSRRRGGPFRPG